MLGRVNNLTNDVFFPQENGNLLKLQKIAILLFFFSELRIFIILRLLWKFFHEKRQHLGFNSYVWTWTES